MKETTAHEEREKKPCLVNHISEKEAKSTSLRECLGLISLKVDQNHADGH